MPTIQPSEDNWKHRGSHMKCRTCMWFVEKSIENDGLRPEGGIGRCRRHSPIMSGWPVVFGTDWCGDHKLDEYKIVGDGSG